MLSFEVWVNGEKQFTVGSDRAEEFGVYLSVYPELQDDFASLEASGYLPSNNEFYDELKWGNRRLKGGDEILIKISNSVPPDPPAVTEQGSGLVSNQKHAMLCSGCGKSQFEVNRLLAMNRINLCNDCVSSIIEVSKDATET